MSDFYMEPEFVDCSKIKQEYVEVQVPKVKQECVEVQVPKVKQEFVEVQVPKIKQECIEVQEIIEEEDSICIKSEPVEEIVEIIDDICYGTEEVLETNSNQPQKCSYPGCTNTAGKPGFNFFRLPVEDKNRVKARLQNIRQEEFLKLGDKTLLVRSLCSKHFKPTESEYMSNFQSQLHCHKVPVSNSNPHSAKNIKVYSRLKNRKSLVTAKKPPPSLFRPSSPKTSSAESVVQSTQCIKSNQSTTNFPRKISEASTKNVAGTSYEQRRLNLIAKMKLKGRGEDSIEYCPSPTDKENTTLTNFSMDFQPPTSSTTVNILTSEKENPYPKSYSATKPISHAGVGNFVKNPQKSTGKMWSSKLQPSSADLKSTFNYINQQKYLNQITNQNHTAENSARILSVQKILVPSSRLGNLKGSSDLNMKLNSINCLKFNSLSQLNKHTSNSEIPTVNEQHLLKKIANLQQRVKIQSNILKSKKRQIARLLKKQDLISKEKIIKGLDLYLMGDVLSFTKAQLLSPHDPGRYPKEFQKFMVTFYDLSWPVYSFLRKRGFQLPYKSTIIKWKQKIMMEEQSKAQGSQSDETIKESTINPYELFEENVL